MYDACIHCPTDVGFTPWRSMHCSIDHFKIFELARDYVNGKLSKDEAIEKLARTNTEGYEDFDTQTGSVLREILKPENQEHNPIPESEVIEKPLRHRKPKIQNLSDEN